MEAPTAPGAQYFNILFLTVTLLIVTRKSISEENDSTSVASRFLSLLKPTNARLTGRPLSLQAPTIKYFLYTRNNTHRAISISASNLTKLNSRKNIIVLIHGWLSTANGYGLSRLKDEYLRRYNRNLILLDWSSLSQLDYGTAVYYLPEVGKIVGNFLCSLNGSLGINLNAIRLVGHSLGAQLSGIVGQRVQVNCKQKIGRITGLDPAGPLFQQVSTTQRLDKSDATFVDVIHTNQGVLGYLGNCGHVDFYVNCGTYQAGCGVTESIEATLCDHRRAMDYMIESVNSTNFRARPCKNCPNACRPSSNRLIYFGENCPRNASGAYVLYTNSQSPYATGPKGFDG